ncbi:peptidase M16 [Exilibacterium tricleocarpae]|uniref:Peptidase M16 n=1 Tax=Exilibacterium tricleocarpae TaxID=2591008 RepID=A0A545TLY0_9GAMM|nr:insulinase family protein [Exilibacterium tricleocarpae]TQV78255.1 peptidase M16 [Exilibacterium tricleocarpae]
MTQQVHPAFEWLRSQRIDSLKVTVEEYRHRKTGAQHIHIDADNEENVFLVALRTVPHDSTGVAHILEHTALCGSERYPVRDPFFMMIRRSLNTFMNAFTSSDWTAYPFASLNRKDFNNLLDVYLDAVFFSRLDELDFRQEGHRVEFEQADDPSTPLVFKGVVYNEMKGAMSSVPSQLWHTLCKYLYPTTTYHYNSGGDPESIPDLTYAQLQAFYRTHYHPSNAIFMTYGNIAAAEHQAKFEAQALARFEPLTTEIGVADEKRYHAPVSVEEHYPLTDDGGLEKKTHIVVSWLLGKSTDLEAALKAQLLASVLFDNSASPLQQALETTELGTAPSPLCGLDDSQREISFVCGVEGSEREHAEAVERLIMAVIEDVATNGIPEEQVQASLHQLELQQREVGGDSYPYGLQLILTGLTSATHRGDPIALLDLDPVLTRLREAIKDPAFIKDLARDLLLDNTHRVRLTLAPDQSLAARRNAAEAQRLAALKATLTGDQQRAVVTQAQALQQRQQQADDESILPKVGLDDIPPHMHYVEGQREQLHQRPLTTYPAGTNGLIYQQIVIRLPALAPEHHTLLPFYTTCLTELGVGERDYLATQRWQSQVLGSISAYTTVRGRIDNVQAIDAHLTVSAKALTRNQAAMSQLMWETLQQVRFDELPRIRELIAQTRARREQSITGNGHSLAMAAAAAGMSPAAKLSHQLSGMTGIKAIKALDDALADAGELADFAARLAAIHQQVLQAPREFLLVGEQEHLQACREQLQQHWLGDPAQAGAAFTLGEVSEKIAQAWIANTQVNFCAKAYPTVPMEHPDAAALTVLGGFLRNGYLHRAIREQGGAYGAGAGQDSNIAAFRFFSYRDPRLEETLGDFDKSLQWLQQETHEWRQVEESILGVISSIDKPSSPAGEAKQTFHAELYGRTREKRERFRNQVLKVTLADLQRVAATYLLPEAASTAVITHKDNTALAGSLSLETIVV